MAKIACQKFLNSQIFKPKLALNKTTFRHFRSDSKINFQKWTYIHQEKWPESCKGNLQSPIDLPPRGTKPGYFPQFNFSPRTHQNLLATMTNNGRTVLLQITSPPPLISGGGLKGKYVFHSFQFHWPSEHRIDGLKFPLEGQFLFYAKEHETFERAVTVKNGIAIFAVFYKISDWCNPAFDFVNEVETVAHKVNRTIKVKSPIILSKLLPLNVNDFYRYEGSFTTPNCSEVVVWTVFPTVVYLHEKQKIRLTQIWDEQNKRLDENNRELQKDNDRIVYFKSDYYSD